MSQKLLAVTLTEEAIAALDRQARTQKISRSELVERYGRSCDRIEAVLDAVEALLYKIKQNGNHRYV